MALSSPASTKAIQWRQPRRLTAIAHALLNGRCQFCAIPTASWAICRGCHEDLPWISAACQRCGLPLASGAALCAGCLGAPPAFDRSLALWSYTSGIDTRIRRFKLAGDLATGRLLTAIAAAQLRARQWRCPAPMIAMPLHPRRLRQRGFNQAQLIARWLGGPSIDTIVARPQYTQSQRQLDAATRRANLRNAFMLKRQPPKAVTLIDDVMTTGASLNALAQCLRAGGTEHIEVIVLARAI